MDSDRLEADLGAAIRGLRLNAGLSRRQLAANANVSLGAMTNLETGKGATTRTLVRALSALGATDWLARLYSPAPTFSPLAAAAAARAQVEEARKVRRVTRLGGDRQ